MATYPGYQNAYGQATGGDVYISSLPDGFSQYVDQYSDIANNYNSWVNDSSNIHWADYVRLNKDLEKAYWDTRTSKQHYLSLWHWGAQHYNNYGKNESRVTPKVVDVPGDLNGDGYLSDDMVTVIVNSWDKNSAASKAAFGQYHFNRPTVQRNEDRIVPGYGPVVTIADNGTSLGVSGGISTSKGEEVYKKVAQLAANSSPGDYKTLVNNIANTLGGTSNVLFKNFAATNQLDTINAYYQTTKVGKPWDAVKQGAQPPTGGFDAEYYRLNTEGGQKAQQEWNNAQSSVRFGNSYLPDLDLTGKYTRDTYLQWYYTTQGKAAGDRGNAAEDAEFAEGYQEFLTDADYQLYRDQVLGLADRFDNIKDWADAQDPAVLKEWYDSLPSDQKAQYDEGTLAVPTLDYIPDRLRSQIKMTKGTTILEGELSTVLGAKEKQQQQMFSALSQDSLKAAAAELQRQKLQEQQFDFYRGLPGFNEIITINESIANSLLGDTGVGGVLGWMGDTTKTQENLEKSLGAATGVPSRSNAVYNWQKWFDEQLVTRYEGGMQITDPLDPSITYEIDAEFAKDYIDRYLKPRFDTSRSMSEFVSYMDVKQNEQNIFQTQSALDSLRDIADLRSKAYLDNVKNTNPLNFSSDFYFDPQGNFGENEPKYQTYLKQKSEVASDWEIAKTKGNTELVPGTDWTWNQWAYYYGLDPNDKNQFAKLHYQVKGAAEGFDPAKDVITLKDAEDYIQTKIIPEITDEKLNIGNIAFLNFVTPEEYADKLLEGISPEQHKEEWDKLLETLGLSDAEMGITEVKQYIIDAFRTGAAKEIRESIKYLNEKKLTPTQERLGVEYIERPEDVAPTDDPNATALYKIFQSAGYQGSEDDFYNDFMPDVDRSEMELVTQAGSDKGLQASSIFSGLSSGDPFEALVSMQSLFDTEDKTTTTAKEEETPSYFKLFEDDTTDEEYKSKTGQKILGEFTSLFKGFS